MNESELNKFVTDIENIQKISEETALRNSNLVLKQDYDEYKPLLKLIKE
jgi:hypothetical protein